MPEIGEQKDDKLRNRERNNPCSDQGGDGDPEERVPRVQPRQGRLCGNQDGNQRLRSLARPQEQMGGDTGRDAQTKDDAWGGQDPKTAATGEWATDRRQETDK